MPNNQPIIIIQNSNPSNGVKMNDLTVSQIFYVIGGILIIFGGLGLVLFNWQDLSAVERILSIFVGIFLLYFVGYIFKIFSKLENLDTLMFFFGTLLFPIFLASLLTGGFTVYQDIEQTNQVYLISTLFGTLWSFCLYFAYPRKALLLVWPFHATLACFAFNGLFQLTDSYTGFIPFMVISCLGLTISNILPSFEEIRSINFFKHSLANPDQMMIIEKLSALLLIGSIAFFGVSFRGDLEWLKFLPSLALLIISMMAGVKKNTYWIYTSVIFLVINVLFIDLPAFIGSLSLPIIVSIAGLLLVFTGIFLSRYGDMFKKKI